MSRIFSGDKLNRGTGLLLIEAINSNPNGDPDRDSDPRTRQDGRGEISPVSFKRKLRDIVEKKDSGDWKDISDELGLSEGGFDILESKQTKREDVKQLESDDFLSKYWDARVFGTTFLEGKKEEENKKKKGGMVEEEEMKEIGNSFIKTGVVQFGLGVSISPVQIERMTTTKVFAVQEDKDKGMAPLAFRIVPYGLYAMPFFVNATAVKQTKCTVKDVELFLRLIPYAYTQSASYIRSQVNIRRAFFVEHQRPRGTFSDFKMIEALTPVRIGNNSTAALSWKDYDEAALNKSFESLEETLGKKTSKIIDLMELM